jgi:hypothetical protein
MPKFRDVVRFLVPRWKARAAGRRVELDETHVMIAPTWWARLGYGKVRFGRFKGQPIPRLVEFTVADIESMEWKAQFGPFRAKLIIDVPGRNDRWCIRGLFGGSRKHRLKTRSTHRNHIAWIALGIWHLRPDLETRQRVGFPRLAGPPRRVTRWWQFSRTVEMRDAVRGRRRRVGNRARVGPQVPRQGRTATRSGRTGTPPVPANVQKFRDMKRSR